MEICGNMKFILSVDEEPKFDRLIMLINIHIFYNCMYNFRTKPTCNIYIHTLFKFFKDI